MSRVYFISLLYLHAFYSILIRLQFRGHIILLSILNAWFPETIGIIHLIDHLIVKLFFLFFLIFITWCTPFNISVNFSSDSLYDLNTLPV